jgi:hypothetical protein
MAGKSDDLAKKLTVEISRLTPAQVFDQYQADVEWFRSVTQEGDRRFIRESLALLRIADEKLWEKRTSKRTRKTFNTIDQWINEEGGMSRAKVYSLLRMARAYRGVPERTVMALGYCRANELARISEYRQDDTAKEPNKTFLKAIDKTLKNRMDVTEVKLMVDNALAGEHLDSRRYLSLELSIKSEDYPSVAQAIAVAQARTPLENPDSPTANGIHIVDICKDYLLDPASAKILKQLEEAGAFGNGRFLVED